jgi:hypothetical protein
VVRNCLASGRDVRLINVEVIGPVLLDIVPEPFAPGDQGNFTSLRRDLFALDELEQELGAPVTAVRRIRGKLELRGCTSLEEGLIAPAPTPTEPAPVLFEASFDLNGGEGCDEGKLRVSHIDFRAARAAAFVGLARVVIERDLRLDGAVINGALWMDDVIAGGDVNFRGG